MNLSGNNIILDVHNLTVSYGGKPVLWEIDFEMPAGLLAGIIGPNGSGKSTLLKSIMGLIEPLSGHVTIAGTDLDNVRDKISYVPQRESVDWDFPANVMDVVLMGRYMKKSGFFSKYSKADKEIALQSLERVGMQDFRDRQISKLSGGQQQRVFMARAIAQDADFYLMDEPFAGVDASSERMIMDVLMDMRKNGKSLLIVHHDLHTARDYFDWVVMLNTRLVAAGMKDIVFTEKNLQEAYGGKLTILSQLSHLVKEKQFPVREQKKEVVLTDPNAILVLLGSVLIALCSGLVGTFTLLRKRALVGDAVAHSILPGVCIAFMFSGSKNMIYLLPGALIAGWISLLAMDIIVRKTKLKTDSATAIVLSVFFGFGIFLLTIIQKSGEGAQSGLDQFLFGKAAAMLPSDIAVFIAVVLIMVFVTIAFFRPLFIVSFNPDFAKTLGMKVSFYEFLLSTMTVLTVSAGIQAVGVVLMAALLITPAAAARIWTDNLLKMMIISAVLAGIAAICGTWVSYLIPGMPTGPWIIMFLSIMAVSSIFMAPGKGIFARWITARKNSKKIVTENVLKHFYLYCEKANDFNLSVVNTDMDVLNYMTESKQNSVLNELLKNGLLGKTGNGWKLTDKGIQESMRIVRLHRLWEMYLNQKLNLKPDHVHEGAEAMEHLITPELEEMLKNDLGNPGYDPHNSTIPYSNQP